jgi:D-glycero-D-manno-heptose 1,7-bisphosphate phosphatase
MSKDKDASMSRNSRPAVFLDRDGVINKSVVRQGVSHPPDHLGEFEFLPGVVAAAQRLAEAGWPMVVVTNQPDVARGVQTRERVEEMNRHVLENLPVLEVVTCYHDTADHCTCRKPRPGLLLQAAERWRLDTTRSVMVGDRWSDVVAGQDAGCTAVLIVTPHSGKERCRPDHCVSDLAEAAAWILETFTQRSVA